MTEQRSYDFDALHAAVTGRAFAIAKEIDPSVNFLLCSTGGSQFTRLIVHGQNQVTLHASPSRPEATWTVEGYGEFVFRFDEDQVAMLARFEAWFTEALRAVC